MVRLSHEKINRLRSLLDMWYLPSEIAEETGISITTIYKNYIPAGLPNKRDDTGHIWIRGAIFAEWVKRLSVGEKQKMNDDQAYCFRCRAVVEMAGEMVVKPTNKYLEMVHCQCSECGGNVTRARKRGQ